MAPKELTELLDLVVDAVGVGMDAAADKKISIEDAALLLKLIPSIGPALSDLDKIPMEIEQMTAAEAGELVAHVMARLTVADVKARKIINASLKMLGVVVELVAAIKAPDLAPAPAVPPVV